MAGAGADGERRIGVAMDYSDSSKKALAWAVDNLLRHGDTLVVLHVLHHGGEEAKHTLWAKSDPVSTPAAPSSAEIFFLELIRGVVLLLAWLDSLTS